MLPQSFTRVYRFVPQRVFFCTWLGVVALIAVARAAEDFRTWSDATGNFKVEAKLIKVEGNDVYLESKAGKALKIPKDKLSAPDQKHLTDSQPAQNPFQAAEPAKPANPSTPGSIPAKGSRPQPNAKVDDTPPPAPELQQTLTPDWTNVKELGSRFGGSTEWKLPPSESKAETITAKTFALPSSKGFHDSFDNLVFSKPSKRVMVSYLNPFPIHVGVSRMMLVDMLTGKGLGGVTYSGTFKVLALNDAGDELIVSAKQKDSWAISNLEVWKLGKSGIERLRGWQLSRDGDNWNKEAVWGMYLSDTHVIVKSNWNKYVIWDIVKGQPLGEFGDRSSWSQLAISPDRKWLALSGQREEVKILDTQTLTLVGTKESKIWSSGISFSPDSKRLAIFGRGELSIWDLTTGTNELAMAGNRMFGWDGDLRWTDSQYLMIGDTVVDTLTGKSVWSYSGITKMEVFGGWCWVYVSEGSEHGIVPVKLPHAAGIAAAKAWVPPPVEYLVKAGETLAVDVSGIGDGAQQLAAEEAILKQMLKQGYQYNQQAPTKIIALTEQGKTQELRYRKFGAGFGGGNEPTYSFTPTISRLKIVRDDKVLWSTSSGGYSPGGFIRLAENQTIEDYLNKAAQPDYRIFANPPIPKEVEKPGRNYTPGSSRITSAGVK